MQTKIEMVYHSTGTLEKVNTKDDVVFQGSVATSEFYLKMAEDVANEDAWLPTDSVFICFKRSDGEVSAPLLMHYESGYWKYVSNGWLEDVDLGGKDSTYTVNVLMRRYSKLNQTTLVATRTSEQIDLPISPSLGWTPKNISNDVYDEIIKVVSEQNEVVEKIDNFQIGTVNTSTIESNEEAKVEANIVDDEANNAYKLNMSFAIPRGKTGDTGKQGPIGPQGERGEGYSVYKTYPSIFLMNEDAENVPEGKFVIITSSIDDEDNAKEFVKNSDGGFTFIVDLSGAVGMSGPDGPIGPQGIQGEQGKEGLSIYFATGQLPKSTEILLSDIKIPEGRTIQLNDLVIDEFGNLFVVSAIYDSVTPSVFLDFLYPLKGNQMLFSPLNLSETTTSISARDVIGVNDSTIKRNDLITCNNGNVFLVDGMNYDYTIIRITYLTSYKGATGAAAGFGTPTANATQLPAGSAPTATVTASGADTAKVFEFEFGIPAGEQGLQGNGYYRANVALTTTSTSVARTSINPTGKKLLSSDTIVDTTGLVFAVTADTEASATTVPIAYRGSIQGATGTPGETPTISATATVSMSSLVSTPSVTVTKSGTVIAPSFKFAFTFPQQKGLQWYDFEAQNALDVGAFLLQSFDVKGPVYFEVYFGDDRIPHAGTFIPQVDDEIAREETPQPFAKVSRQLSNYYEEYTFFMDYSRMKLGVHLLMTDLTTGSVAGKMLDFNDVALFGTFYYSNYKSVI